MGDVVRTELATKMLRVDLSRRTCVSEEIPAAWISSFLGGKGLGSAYLFMETEGGAEALAPGNPLVFTWGPLTGTAPGCSRYCVVTKSPLTGGLLHSYAGGTFPAQVRWSLPGHLGVLVQGRAEAPVVLIIDRGVARVVDAPQLGGSSTVDVADAFPGYHVAAIGPAGENLVRFATVSNDGGTHHLGRGGAGAVMGAKNLKALVVRGAASTPERAIRDLYAQEARRLMTSESTKAYRDGGTPRLVDMTNATGTLPTRNWTSGTFSQADSINLRAVRSSAVRRVTCHDCPMACGFDLEINTGPYAGLRTRKGPEYESLGMLGANLEIGDLGGVAKLADTCNRVGMDTITAGHVLGWAMECSGRGLIRETIQFGDVERALALLEEIAYRRGALGTLLADGVRKASASLGAEASDAAVEVKGLEPPAYDPRGSYSMGLAYATSDRGACHLRSWAIGGDAFGSRNPYQAEKGHVEAVVAQQNVNSVVPDSLVACSFARYTPERASRWLDALGYSLSPDDLSQTGERIWNLTRLFNVREGMGRAEDGLPKRIRESPLGGTGPSARRVLPQEALDQMLDWYYSLRGWTPSGVPTADKLSELRLDDLLCRDP